MQVRAPEGTSLDETRLTASASRASSATYPEVKLTVTTVERRRGEDAQPRRPSTCCLDRSRAAQGVAERHDGPGAPEVIAKQSTGPAHHGRRGADVRRRRLLDGAHPVHGARAGSEEARGDRDGRHRQAAARCPARSTSTRRSSSASPRSASTSTARARRTSACSRATSRTRCACSSQGEQVSNYEERGEEYEVHVRAEPQYRADEEGLRLLTVPSSRLGFVPLADVVQLRQATGPVAHRPPEPRARRSRSSRTPRPASATGTIAAALKKILDDEHLPRGYAAAPTGQTREMGRVFLAFVGGARPVVHLHVPGARGAVRVVAAPDHDPAVACR